jgi:hypothetical protein
MRTKHLIGGFEVYIAYTNVVFFERLDESFFSPDEITIISKELKKNKIKYSLDVVADKKPGYYKFITLEIDILPLVLKFLEKQTLQVDYAEALKEIKKEINNNHEKK